MNKEYKFCWIIGDDCSPSGSPAPKIMDMDVIVYRQEHNVGQPTNYLQTVEKARAYSQWVLVVDDDGEVVAPDIINRLLWLVRKYPDAQCYSAFNSPYHAAAKVYDDHVLKHSTCEHGRFFRSNWSGFGEVPWPIPVLRPSALQHCGKFGLNGTEDDFDRELRAGTITCA